MTAAVHSRMSKAELEALLAHEKFVYQRMDLPHGLATRGEDRSATARAILPERMDGRAVLDVGCCYGFFLYEAQKRGATRLVGLEKNPERLRHARLLRDVYGATLELGDDDFQTVCEREAFDDVLLLNVLHHLKEPVAALRTLARAARKRLIVEFPTPADPKFARGLLPGVAAALTRLPIIGVSSLAENDQTFLFSKAALERVLTEHEPLFAKITFLPSPKKEKGRLIAICEK
ncbi:MAG: class I SAM-dependent methyltransferase [Planctomycetes bacterium]|nr:class I SAM-dependent methyltransferase [Planctomycetota bacterium]